MLLALLAACAARPVSPASSSSPPLSQPERGEHAALLMAHPLVSEASLAPVVRLRNQPQVIYRRYAEHREDYRECLARAAALQGRYYRVRYRAPDGWFVEGIVALPEGFDPDTPHPLMIYNRGNWEEGRRFTYCFTRPLEQWTAQGFVVFAPQYGGTAGGEGHDAYGGRDVGDVTALAEIARAYPFTDPDNVFMQGDSRGGMMTLLAIKAGVPLNAAIVNCALLRVAPDMRDDVVARVLPEGLSEADREAAYAQRSALSWPEAIQAPLLIVHGARDEGVPVDDARALAGALAARGQPHRLVVYPEAGHCGEGYPDAFPDELTAWVSQHRR